MAKEKKEKHKKDKDNKRRREDDDEERAKERAQKLVREFQSSDRAPVPWPNTSA